MIMFAPLPKDWLAKLVGRNRAKRFDELLAIKRCCQQHLGVLDVGFVGKREKSQDAFALVLEFRVVDQARQFYTALSPGGEAFHADRLPESLCWCDNTGHGVQLLGTPRGSDSTR